MSNQKIKPLKPFRYSGNKSKYVKFYKSPPEGTKRIVEIFAGSMAYSLAHNFPALGFEINTSVVDMWNWLKQVTPQDLKDFDQTIKDEWKKIEQGGKFDIRRLALSTGPQTYARVNITGVVVGQLFAWKVYPQHNLPINDTIACLPHFGRIDVSCGDGLNYTPQEGDCLFIDPPYLGTQGGYYDKTTKKNHETNIDHTGIADLIDNCKVPVIFTYGNGAQELFPQYNWQKIAERKVPKIRSGGTSDRFEHVAYINF